MGGRIKKLLFLDNMFYRICFDILNKKLFLLIIFSVLLAGFVSAAWTHDPPAIYYKFDNSWEDNGNYN